VSLPMSSAAQRSDEAIAPTSVGRRPTFLSRRRSSCDTVLRAACDASRADRPCASHGADALPSPQ
jgi:hypothetical protein